MDQQLLYLFNRTWTNSTLDWVMVVASNAALWTPFLILGAGLALIFGKFRVRAFVICAAIALGLVDGVSTNLLKKAVGRPRPKDVRNDVRIIDLAKASPRLLALAKPLKVRMSRASEKRVAGNSFPSGHTANNFTVATMATIFFPRRGWILFLTAALVGYSRVYVGAHYPSDVAVTFFLAIGQALLIFSILSAAWKKWAPRWMPQIAARHPDLA